MNNQTFSASAGYHLAEAGTDRNVALTEQIGILEQNRIRVSNAPEITRLGYVLSALEAERRQLVGALEGAVREIRASFQWPIWQTIMTALFVAAAFALTLMSLAPFDFSPVLMWVCAVGIACLCAYGTAEFLERTEMDVIVLGLAIVLFIASLIGAATLASVRGDIFLHQLASLTASGEEGSTTVDGLAFYQKVGPKMQVFLTFLSLSIDLAAGLALHGVRSALRTRPAPPSPESLRLRLVEREISETQAQLRFLHNEPEAFLQEYRRNLYIGLLKGAAVHARAYAKSLPTIVLAVIGIWTTMKGQAIDLRAGLDLSATSKATGYDGSIANVQNIEAGAALIKMLPSGSHVEVYGISDESFSRPLVILAGIIPSDPGRLREFDPISEARARMAMALRRSAKSIEPRFVRTDILGFLVMTGMGFQTAANTRRVLVLFSDMRQSTRQLDIEHASIVEPERAIAAVRDQHLLADLAGVDVYIFGVHAAGKDVRYWQSLRDFWKIYFEQCHATLRVFSITREVSNIGLRR